MVDIIELQKGAIEREGVLAVRDANVVARYDATDLNYVVRDSSGTRVRALLDKSKRLQLGAERVRNGNFDTALDWLTIGGFSISGGSANCTDVIYSQLYQVNVFEVGKVYQIRGVNNKTTGNIMLGDGADSGVVVNSGAFTINHVAMNPNIYFRTSSFIGSVDNISIKEIIGNHITQTTLSKMPLHLFDVATNEWYALFDGVDDNLKSLPFTLNQPTGIYSCLKQVTWASGDAILDGNYNYQGALQQTNTSPIIRLAIFASGANNANLQIGSFGNAYALFSGVNSKIKVNNTTQTTANIDNVSMGGFTLGCLGTATSGFANIAVKEIVIKNVATDESDSIFNYFKNKHKVVY